MLDPIAEKLARSPLLRHAYFLACALLSIFLVGYYFGTFDQAIHIPFLKAAVDESLYPGDAFIALRHTHYSYFWLFFRPLLRAGVLEISMFALHVLATYLTFWALWELSRTLFRDALAALFGTLAFVSIHVFFAGFPLIEFSLLNRTFVLPFILFALNLYLRRHYLPAFLLLGLMYNLHVISVNFAMAMLLFASVIEIRRVGWRNLLGGLALFLAAAAPVLFWKAGSTPLDLSLRPEWLKALSDGQLYHLFHIIGPSVYTFAIGLCNLACIALFFIAYFELMPLPPAPGGLWRRAWQDLGCYLRAENPSPQRTGLLFVLAMVLVVALQEFCAHYLPVTILIQSQIIRAGVMAALFAYLYFARYLAELSRTLAWKSGGFLILAFAFFLGPLPIWPVVVWALLRWLPLGRGGRARLGRVMVVTIALSAAVSLYYQVWKPGLYIFGPGGDWQDAQEWARRHTPVDAVFITPPEIWWMYQSEWRVFSERSSVSTLAELLEAAFDPAYLPAWQERFEALAPGAQAQFHGDFLANIQTTRRAYYGMDDARILQAACRFGASYLVVEAQQPRSFAKAYENGGYIIYQLPPDPCTP